MERVVTWKPGPSAPGRKVRVRADWLLVREHGVPAAEIFHVSYQAMPVSARRPVTFLFNGGPGAASAFLHLGTAGPRRVEFGERGSTLPPPGRLTDNHESWLRFSDLVFVDPVGTGLSRTVAESRLEQSGVDTDEERLAKKTKGLPDAKKPFWRVKRDIDVLCEFVSQWLSAHRRWESPVSIAGESYGGFRVGKLVRALPERGVGLRSAIMVSPAMDFLALVGGDYDVMPWINPVPTMALAASYHGRSRGRFAGMNAADLRAAAEGFAENALANLLIRGERVPGPERDRVYRTMAELIGLDEALVRRHQGRVPIEIFGRELLRDRGLLCGLYDAAVTGPNVFPDREGMPNPDPTLAGIGAAFTSGINSLLRAEFGLSTDREYLLLGDEVWKSWADDRMAGYWDRQLDCTDDLRYGLALNPALRLFITHGWYDLVTTYFSSFQSVSLMRLPDALRRNVTLENYDGGHMFYTWKRSRERLADRLARVIPS